MRDQNHVYDFRIPTPWYMRQRYIVPLSICFTVVLVGPLLAGAFLAEDGLGTPFWAALVWIPVALAIFVMFTTLIPMHRSRRMASREVKRISEELDSNPNIGLAQLIEQGELHRADTRYVGMAFDKVGRSIVKGGRPGFVLRYAVGDRAISQLTPLEPIGVAFEPVPLHEEEPTFRGLEEAPTGEARVPVDELTQDLHVPGGPKQRPRRFWARPRPIIIIEILCCAIALVLLASAFLRGPSIDWSGVLKAFVMVSPVLVSRFAGRKASAQTWIFPGGIALPALLGKRHWRVVRRSEGGLIWSVAAGVLLAIDYGRTSTIQVTPNEANLAIRAWLATATLPTDQHLVAYFGLGGQLNTVRPQG